jgi:hypothetical protein
VGSCWGMRGFLLYPVMRYTTGPGNPGRLVEVQPTFGTVAELVDAASCRADRIAVVQVRILPVPNAKWQKKEEFMKGYKAYKGRG